MESRLILTSQPDSSPPLLTNRCPSNRALNRFQGLLRQGSGACEHHATGSARSCGCITQVSQTPGGQFRRSDVLGYTADDKNGACRRASWIGLRKRGGRPHRPAGDTSTIFVGTISRQGEELGIGTRIYLPDVGRPGSGAGSCSQENKSEDQGPSPSASSQHSAGFSKRSRMVLQCYS
jgi:hypothetical protein